MRATSTSVRFAAFLAAVGAAFVAALLAGQLIGPVGPVAAEPAGQDAHGRSTHGHGEAPDAAAGHAAGLAISVHGYTLQTVSTPRAAGVPGELAFRVAGPSGAPVTSYVSTHERPLHLIVVRRDLAGYQHVHPTLGDDGMWRVPITLPAAGSYRLIADFAPDGRTDTVTLGTDIAVPGTFDPQALPAPSTVTEADGYTVRMSRDPTGEVSFAVERGGVPVADLERYLGASGHLVVLRAGDLAYLHSHPDAERPAFRTDPLTPGAYRLFFEFQHGGTVHTAAFTAEEGP